MTELETERVAFRMTLTPGEAEAYKARHDAVYPELLALLKGAGVSDYTIWLDPETHHLFAIMTRSRSHGMDALPDDQVVKRWWAFMADIMETHPDNRPVSMPLTLMFHLP